MELSLRRWRPGHLLASWAAYWTGLVGVKLGPGLMAAWRATQLTDHRGTINAGYDNGVLTLTVIEEGAKTYAATAPFGTVMLWLLGPPLLLWLVWLAVRTRPEDRAAPAPLGSAEANLLSPGAPPAAEWRVDRDVRVPSERGRVRTPNP